MLSTTFTSYFHVVFTLPHQLNALIRQNPVELYNLLFRSVAETLMEVAANPKHLGAEIGFFAILHTWGQNILFHPHIHCVVPSGGLAPGRTHWDTWLRHILLTREGPSSGLPRKVHRWVAASFHSETFELFRSHPAPGRCEEFCRVRSEATPTGMGRLHEAFLWRP